MNNPNLAADPETLAATGDRSAIMRLHIDLSGHLLSVPSRLCERLGRTREALTTTPLETFVHADDRAVLAAAFADLRDGFRYETTRALRLLAASGAVVRACLDLSAVRDENGRTLSVLGYLRELGREAAAEPGRRDAVAPQREDAGGAVAAKDVTDRRRAEAARRTGEAQLREAFAEAPVGMALFDLDGRFQYVNGAYCAITGYEEQELLDARVGFSSLTHPDDLKREREMLDRLVAGEIPAFFDEKRYVRKDGGAVWVRVSASVRRDEQGRPFQIVGLLEDINDRKQTEEFLIAVLGREQEGRQDLMEKEAVLRAKTEELERTNAELEQFAYVASHDLRAPLRAVNSLAQWIDEDLGQRLDPENRQRLGLLRERVTRMDQLIKGLLTYARLGRPPVAPTAIELLPLLRGVVEELAPPPGYRVLLEGNFPSLKADPIHLRQVFQNLIGNAIEHRDRPEGTVWVRSREDGDVWRLEVADDGPGIPPSARPTVFNLFSGTAGGDHTGIGLAVVKKLVLTYGGTIEVTDNLPRGASFRICWPKSALDVKKEGL